MGEGRREREERLKLKTEHVQKPCGGQEWVVTEEDQLVFGRRMKSEWKVAQAEAHEDPGQANTCNHVLGQIRKPATWYLPEIEEVPLHPMG